jgi:hypothetical protein
VSFYTETGSGGEDAVVAQTGVSLSLLDFAFNIPLGYSHTTHLEVGRFKVPYGRAQGRWLVPDIGRRPTASG